MDEKEARRKIAALIAIIQTMIQEVYSGTGEKGGRELLNLQLEEDELLAMTIGNELTEEEIDRAFSWVGEAYGSSRDEIAASPVAPHVSEEQRTRARVALLANEEADNAHTLAIRVPDRPGEPPLTAEDRIRIGEEAFLGRIEIDVLHEQEGWSAFTRQAKSVPDERLEDLPEPWRKQAKKRLPELRARLIDTLEKAECGRVTP